MPFNDLLLANHNLRSGPQDIAAPHQLNSQKLFQAGFLRVNRDARSDNLVQESDRKRALMGRELANAKRG